MTINIRPLKVIPRKVGGVDFEREQVLLAFSGEAMRLFDITSTRCVDQPIRALVWRRAGKAWAGRVEGYQPVPAELVLLEILAGDHRVREKVLHEGGRLSLNLLAAYASAIDRHFGVALWSHLTAKCTIEVVSRDPEIAPAVGSIVRQTGFKAGSPRYYRVAARADDGFWMLAPCSPKGRARDEQPITVARMSAMYYSEAKP